MIRLIDYLHRKRFFIFIYWAMKIGLGFAFIISGARKLPGVKFTSIPISNPVGLFFEGMYVTGFYLEFHRLLSDPDWFIIIDSLVEEINSIAHFSGQH